MMNLNEYCKQLTLQRVKLWPVEVYGKLFLLQVDHRGVIESIISIIWIVFWSWGEFPFGPDYNYHSLFCHELSRYLDLVLNKDTLYYFIDYLFFILFSFVEVSGFIGIIEIPRVVPWDRFGLRLDDFIILFLGTKLSGVYNPCYASPCFLNWYVIFYYYYFLCYFICL
jgi:hypothetical protein